MSDYNMISLGHNISLHIGFHQSIGSRPPAESSGHCCSNGSGGLLQSACTPRSSHHPPSASSPPAGSAPQPRHLETSSGAHTHLPRTDPVLAVLTPPSPPPTYHSQSGASPPKAHCEDEKIVKHHSNEKNRPINNYVNHQTKQKGAHLRRRWRSNSLSITLNCLHLCFF